MTEDKWPANGATEALRIVGRHIDVKDIHVVEPLRLHDACTFRFPEAGLVTRLTPANDEAIIRANRALQLTAWLATQNFPAVRPALSEPIAAGNYTATIWHEIPRQSTSPRLSAHIALGKLLRAFHELPTPPIPLPRYTPFSRLHQAITLDSARETPTLSSSDRAFLLELTTELAVKYDNLNFPLGIGLIHNDAHTGNLLVDPRSPFGYSLIDWESACQGPREMDVTLVGAPGNRFGDPDNVRREFSSAYGYNIATWPDHQLLRDIRDLHSLSAHIRASVDNPAARNQLRRRLHSLQVGDRTIQWSGV
ncbi:phosphotransferase family protein [Micromonospora sp. NPDC003197]